MATFSPIDPRPMIVTTLVVVLNAPYEQNAPAVVTVDAAPGPGPLANVRRAAADLG